MIISIVIPMKLLVGAGVAAGAAGVGAAVTAGINYIRGENITYMKPIHPNTSKSQKKDTCD